MDFKDFINQIKELADPAVFAIIAKLAIAFYFLKLLFKGFKELLKFIFAIKEKKEGYEELQKTNLESKEQITQLKEAFEKANIANQKRDEETHKLIKQFMLENEKKISKLEEDLNAYKKVKHGKDTEVEEARKTMKLVLEKLTTNNKL
jgi:exoribonuclease R